jgi:hypothetical protein
LKELRDFKCLDGHESIVRVSAHISCKPRGKDWGIISDWLCLHRIGFACTGASFRFAGTVLSAIFFVRLPWPVRSGAVSGLLVILV